MARRDFFERRGTPRGRPVAAGVGRAVTVMGGLILIVASGLACGTPSRRLTTRAVDDPEVLPRRLLSLRAGWSVAHVTPSSHWKPWTQGDVVGKWQYGITDRLQLEDVALRYAFLDDAPSGSPSGGRPDRLSLSALAGFRGIGVGSLTGFIAVPVLGVRTSKHLGSRVLLRGSLDWLGTWQAKLWDGSGEYFRDLTPYSGRTSHLDLSATVLVQLVDHLAVVGGSHIGQRHACTIPDCAWASREWSIHLGPDFRPWHWLSLSARADMGSRYRPDRPDMPTVRPDLPVPQRPSHVSWWTLSGWADFTW